jgi:HD-like signal output (HDOD) protein/CheY-like chemotaxis protein
MRVIFVDDEERVLNGVARSLFSLGVTWQLSFVTSGENALAELEGAPADVVISDMQMPSMDGQQLLTEVRARWPSAFRIMLSGDSDEQQALRSLDVVHQFLAKPCSGVDIVAVVERMYALRALLDCPTLQAVVGRAGTLPPTPKVYRELVRCIADSGMDNKSVGAVLNRDPALAAKVLHVANSAFFGRGKPIVDVDSAITCIGLERLRALVLVMEVFIAGERFGAAAHLQRRALMAGLIAERVGTGRPYQREASTAALLSDVGLLIPAIEAHCRHADLRGEGTFTHVEAGAYLLGMWGLPTTIVEAVAFHREPWRVHPREFGAVSVAYVASCLARGIEPSLEYLNRCGLKPQLDGWKRYADQLNAELP